MSFHKLQPVGEIHQVHNWSVADATARLALSLFSTDIGKVCRQADTGDFYLLQNNVGPVWVNLNSASGVVFRPVKNLIINGGFLVNQRQKTGSVVLAAGAYGHDLWKAGAGGCTYTFATSLGITTITITAGTLVQKIDETAINSGNYCLAWSGTSTGRFNAGLYGASGVSANLTGAAALTIEFGTGTLSNVRLTQGLIIQAFEPENYTEALNRCLPYCFRPSLVGSITTVFQLVGCAQTTTAGFFFGNFPVTMKASPSFVVEGALSQYTVYNVLTSTYSGALTVFNQNAVTNTGFYLLNIQVASGFSVGGPIMFSTNAQNVDGIRWEAPW